ncbi:ferredoxin-type protein NapG [Pseudothauera rhizosphaerae]|uniref:Ferredoxin-type protein NapG n=1 Tax=Pseudothauera rhizosphaerae TaxID=2565932 RepID=A0A4S4ALC3_9RHOO|nr:ferredoxin-type protein NapG [Pseudothauera rhizosphaerae]THF60315.1 ferredoxin-type protein NapG [Pseudothauera rhizosphaerae]
MSDKQTQHAEEPRTPPRRRFLREAAGVAGGAGLLALGVGLYARQASALPASALRPPGALAEEDFLAACVRCGLCVRDCPYDTLELAELGDGIATGTPYFNARRIPCEMCEDIPCVVACPTGALDRGLTDIGNARMGLAVLIDQETCLNYLGLRCDVCYRVCPVIDKAITLELFHNPRSDRHAMFLPTVHSDHCTGCGKCEQACVLPGEAAIKVLPIALAKGSTAEHYRKGWEERAAHGRSLIGDQVELPVRGMEGQAYGDTRLRQGSAPQPGADEPAPYAPGGLDSGWKP